MKFVSKSFEYVVPVDLFVIADHAEDRGECPGSQWFMRWDGQSLAGGMFCSQDDVAAGLMEFYVLPITDEVVGERSAVEIPRCLHATARTCSTWRKSRMRAGGVES